MLMIFEIKRFLKLYGVSSSLLIASKESQDLSKAPRALIETANSNDNKNNYKEIRVAPYLLVANRRLFILHNESMNLIVHYKLSMIKFLRQKRVQTCFKRSAKGIELRRVKKKF